MNLWHFVTRPDPAPWPAVIDAPGAAGGQTVYRVPFPPPAGRRVRDVNGHVWVIDPTGDVAREDDRSIILTWGQLIATGPLQLMELTDAEKASEALYGPVGARWGIPGTPCAYNGCALDVGHAGAHLDAAGDQLGMTDAATEPYVQPAHGAMLSRICTCGVIRHTATQHEPGCARYVSPRQDDTVPSAVQPTGWEIRELPDGTAFVGTDDEFRAATENITETLAEERTTAVDVVAPKPRATKRTRSAGTSSAPATGRKRTPPRKAN